MNGSVLKLALLLALCISACKKVKEKADVEKPMQDSAMKYTILGLRDGLGFYEGYGDSSGLSLNFFFTSGEKEEVHLSVDGLPDGLTAVFLPPAGIPTFTSRLHFTDNGVAPGSYKITISSTTKTGDLKRSVMNIRVHDVCDKKMPGVYQNRETIKGAYPYKDTVIITTIEATSSPNRILLKNLLFIPVMPVTPGYPNDVYATLNCSGHTLTTPYGTGNYTDSTVDLDLKIMVDPELKTYAEITCHLVRK